MRLTAGSEYNAAECVLDMLRFVNSGSGCAKENRVGVVQARTDQGMGYDRCCVSVCVSRVCLR